MPEPYGNAAENARSARTAGGTRWRGENGLSDGGVRARPSPRRLRMSSQPRTSTTPPAGSLGARVVVSGKRHRKLPSRRADRGPGLLRRRAAAEEGLVSARARSHAPHGRGGAHGVLLHHPSVLNFDPLLHASGGRLQLIAVIVDQRLSRSTSVRTAPERTRG
jgi:hypothetical protein